MQQLCADVCTIKTGSTCRTFLLQITITRRVGNAPCGSACTDKRPLIKALGTPLYEAQRVASGNSPSLYFTPVSCSHISWGSTNEKTPVQLLTPSFPFWKFPCGSYIGMEL